MKKVEIDLPSLHKEGRLQGRSTKKERHTHPFDLKRHSKMFCFPVFIPPGIAYVQCIRLYGTK